VSYTKIYYCDHCVGETLHYRGTPAIVFSTSRDASNASIIFSFDIAFR